QMLDYKREILCETIIARNEPAVRFKPRHPLRRLDLLSKGLAAKLEVGISLLREPSDALRGKRNSRRERRTGPEKESRPRIVVRLQERTKKGNTVLMRHSPT